MSSREVLLDGGSPWGFRMHGGADHGGPLKISRVNPGSKAAARGVREGDVITTINSQSAKSLSNSDAHTLLRTAGETLLLGLNEDNAASPKRSRTQRNQPESKSDPTSKQHASPPDGSSEQTSDQGSNPALLSDSAASNNVPRKRSRSRKRMKPLQLVAIPATAALSVSVDMWPANQEVLSPTGGKRSRARRARKSRLKQKRGQDDEEEDDEEPSCVEPASAEELCLETCDSECIASAVEELASSRWEQVDSLEDDRHRADSLEVDDISQPVPDDQVAVNIASQVVEDIVVSFTQDIQVDVVVHVVEEVLEENAFVNVVEEMRIEDASPRIVEVVDEEVVEDVVVNVAAEVETPGVVALVVEEMVQEDVVGVVVDVVEEGSCDIAAVLAESVVLVDVMESSEVECEENQAREDDIAGDTGDMAVTSSASQHVESHGGCEEVTSLCVAKATESTELRAEETTEIKAEESSQISSNETAVIKEERSTDIKTKETEEIKVKASTEINTEESKVIKKEGSTEIKAKETEDIKEKGSTEINVERTTEVQEDETTEIKPKETAEVKVEGSTEIIVEVTTEVKEDTTEMQPKETAEVKVEIKKDGTIEIKEDVSTIIETNETAEIMVKGTTEVKEDGSTEVKENGTTEIKLEETTEIKEHATTAEIKEDSTIDMKANEITEVKVEGSTETMEGVTTETEASKPTESQTNHFGCDSKVKMAAHDAKAKPVKPERLDAKKLESVLEKNKKSKSSKMLSFVKELDTKISGIKTKVCSLVQSGGDETKVGREDSAVEPLIEAVKYVPRSAESPRTQDVILAAKERVEEVVTSVRSDVTDTMTVEEVVTSVRIDVTDDSSELTAEESVLLDPSPSMSNQEESTLRHFLHSLNLNETQTRPPDLQHNQESRTTDLQHKQDAQGQTSDTQHKQEARTSDFDIRQPKRQISEDFYVPHQRYLEVILEENSELLDPDKRVPGERSRPREDAGRFRPHDPFIGDIKLIHDAASDWASGFDDFRDRQSEELRAWVRNCQPLSEPEEVVQDRGSRRARTWEEAVFIMEADETDDEGNVDVVQTVELPESSGDEEWRRAGDDVEIVFIDSSSSASSVEDAVERVAEEVAVERVAEEVFKEVVERVDEKVAKDIVEEVAKEVEEEVDKKVVSKEVVDGKVAKEVVDKEVVDRMVAKEVVDKEVVDRMVAEEVAEEVVAKDVPKKVNKKLYKEVDRKVAEEVGEEAVKKIAKEVNEEVAGRVAKRDEQQDIVYKVAKDDEKSLDDVKTAQDVHIDREEDENVVRVDIKKLIAAFEDSGSRLTGHVTHARAGLRPHAEYIAFHAFAASVTSALGEASRSLDVTGEEERKRTSEELDKEFEEYVTGTGEYQSHNAPHTGEYQSQNAPHTGEYQSLNTPHTGEYQSLNAPHTGEYQSLNAPHTGEKKSHNAPHTGEYQSQNAPHTGEYQSLKTPHTGEYQSLNAPHTGEYQSLNAPHTGEKKSHNAPHTGEYQSLNAPHTGEYQSLNAPHTGEYQSLNAPHSGEKKSHNAPHTGEYQSLNAPHTGEYQSLNAPHSGEEKRQNGVLGVPTSISRQHSSSSDATSMNTVVYTPDDLDAPASGPLQGPAITSVPPAPAVSPGRGPGFAPRSLKLLCIGRVISLPYGVDVLQQVGFLSKDFDTHKAATSEDKFKKTLHIGVLSVADKQRQVAQEFQVEASRTNTRMSSRESPAGTNPRTSSRESPPRTTPRTSSRESPPRTTPRTSSRESPPRTTPRTSSTLSTAGADAWLGTPTPTPHLLVCLSPAQRRSYHDGDVPTPEEAERLLDLHRKFSERRGAKENDNKKQFQSTNQYDTTHAQEAGFFTAKKLFLEKRNSLPEMTSLSHDTGMTSLSHDTGMTSQDTGMNQGQYEALLDYVTPDESLSNCTEENIEMLEKQIRLLAEKNNAMEREIRESERENESDDVSSLDVKIPGDLAESQQRSVVELTRHFASPVAMDTAAKRQRPLTGYDDFVKVSLLTDWLQHAGGQGEAGGAAVDLDELKTDFKETFSYWTQKEKGVVEVKEEQKKTRQPQSFIEKKRRDDENNRRWEQKNNAERRRGKENWREEEEEKKMSEGKRAEENNILEGKRGQEKNIVERRRDEEKKRSNEEPRSERRSLPREQFEEQLKYVQDLDKRRYSYQERRFDARDFKISKRGDIAVERPKSLAEGEVFRQQMYQEYMQQVAQRAERRRQKVLKITAGDVTADSEPPGDGERKLSATVEDEFIAHVRRRNDKLGLHDDAEEDGGYERRMEEDLKSVSDESSFYDSSVIEDYVIEGDVTLMELPAHLQEYLAMTSQQDEDEGVWSPGQQTPVPSSPQQVSRFAYQKPQEDPEPIPVVWTPKSAGASPQLERKEFRPVPFESPTLQRKNKDAAAPPAPPPPTWEPPLSFPSTRSTTSISSSSNKASTLVASSLERRDVLTERRLTSSKSAPASGLYALTSTSNLPRVQSPTITLLQKAREGQLPRGAHYLDQEDQTNYISKDYVSKDYISKDISKDYVSKDYVSKDYRSDYNSDYRSDYDSEAERKAEPRPKIEGIGPTTRDGMPIVLRSEVKDENHGKWYKKMYDSLHRAGKEDDHVTVRYKARRGKYPYTSAGGYASEPDHGACDPDLDNYAKYATLDRRRIKNKETDYTSSLPRARYSPHPDAIKYATDIYKNQPGRIENYQPGRSSISDKETKQWWDEVLDIFDVAAADQHSSQQTAIQQQQQRAAISQNTSKSFMSHALKESGYESDSTLVFKRRDDTQSALSPVEHKMAYKSIQKGGEAPLHGFRKMAPERPKDCEMEYFPLSPHLTRIRVHKQDITPLREFFCYPVTSFSSYKRSLPSCLSPPLPLTSYKRSLPSCLSPPLPPPPRPFPPKRRSSYSTTLRLLSTLHRHRLCHDVDVKRLRERLSHKLGVTTRVSKEDGGNLRINRAVSLSPVRSAMSLSSTRSSLSPDVVTRRPLTRMCSPDVAVRRSAMSLSPTRSSLSPDNAVRRAVTRMCSPDVAVNKKQVCSELRSRKAQQEACARLSRSPDSVAAAQLRRALREKTLRAKKMDDKPLARTTSSSSLSKVKSKVDSNFSAVEDKKKKKNGKKKARNGKSSDEGNGKRKTRTKKCEEDGMEFGDLPDLQNSGLSLKSDTFFQSLFLRDVPSPSAIYRSASIAERARRFDAHPQSQGHRVEPSVYLTHRRPVSDSKFRSLDRSYVGPRSLGYEHNALGKERSASEPPRSLPSKLTREIRVRSPLPGDVKRVTSLIPVRVTSHALTADVITRQSSPSPSSRRMTSHALTADVITRQSSPSPSSRRIRSQRSPAMTSLETVGGVRQKIVEAKEGGRQKIVDPKEGVKQKMVEAKEGGRQKIVDSKEGGRQKSVDSVVEGRKESIESVERGKEKYVMSAERVREKMAECVEENSSKEQESGKSDRHKVTRAKSEPRQTSGRQERLPRYMDDYALQLMRATHKSPRFQELSSFYTQLERVAQLEKTASTGDLRPRLRSEEKIIDYDRWQRLRTRERAEHELRTLHAQLLTSQRDRDLLYQTHDVTRWRGDRGLRVKEKSVEDLKQMFAKLKVEESELEASRRRDLDAQKDVYKPLWRGASVLNLATSLNALPKSQGHRQRLWSSLSREQVSALKTELSDLMSARSGKEPLRVRCNSLLSRDQMYSPTLRRQEARRSDSASISSIPHMRSGLTESDKKRLSLTLSQEVLARMRRERDVTSPASPRTCYSLDNSQDGSKSDLLLVLTPADDQHVEEVKVKSETESASSDASVRTVVCAEPFRSRQESPTTPRRTSTQGSPSQTPRRTALRTSQSASDLKELFGERRRVASPPQRSPTKRGDVTRLRDKFESLEDLRYLPFSLRQQVLKRFGSDPELSRDRGRPRTRRDRFMPHINVISKLAQLQRRSQARMRDADTLPSVRRGEVDKIRDQFEDMSLLGQMYTSTPDVRELRDIRPYLGCSWVAHRHPRPVSSSPPRMWTSSPTRPRPASSSPPRPSILKPRDAFANQHFDPAQHTPAFRYQPASTSPVRGLGHWKTAPSWWWRHRLSPQCYAKPTVTFREPVRRHLARPTQRGARSTPGSRESPGRYVESEVTIHYKSPVRAEAKEALSEEELARIQAEAMRRIYQEERRRKYLHELQDMNSRRHTDNFTPSQKSPIPLNRYDDFFDDLPQVRSKSRERTPEPKLVARALYNFQGQTSRELSFRRGDVIFVRKQIDKNWYEGEHNAMVGLFPFNYVEIIPYDPLRTLPRKSSEGQARAKFNFIAQTHLELSLVKGELVLLTRRVDDNWFEGRIGNRKGIFPVSYVDVLCEPGERPVTPLTLSTTKPIAAPASHSLIINGQQQSINSQHHYIPPEASTNYYNQSKSNPYLATKTPAGKFQAPVNQSLHIDTHSDTIPYRALYNYRPQNDDELELKENDTVYVMEKCDDGWYVGSSHRTGYFGTFPGNYVERI